MFEFKGSEHLRREIETIDEVRVAIAWMYMISGDRFGTSLMLRAGLAKPDGFAGF